jgi:cytochrome b561
MDTQPTSLRYDPVMQAVHWATLLLVAATFAAIWIADPGLVGSYARPIVQIHRSLGLTICALTIFRLVWRLRSRVPELPADVPKIQKMAARANEGVIYLLLMAQPLVGLAYTNAYGVRVNLFLLAQLPPILGKGRETAALLGDIHRLVGYTLLTAIGLHAAAALYHHFIRRDGVLNAMLPARLRRAER